MFAADLFVDGLLGVALALGIAPFVLSVALSGFETENLATGIAANAKGLPGAAAGTFLGGVTFLAFGVAGLGGLIAPIRVELPTRVAVCTSRTSRPRSPSQPEPCPCGSGQDHRISDRAASCNSSIVAVASLTQSLMIT